MDSQIERVALKVTDDRMAELLEISVRHGAEMRTSRRSRFFYPKRVGDGKFEIPPITIGADYQLNIFEQKNDDGSANVICSTKGEKVIPFWVMDDRSRSPSGVHVRFSSAKPVFRINLDAFGGGRLERIWLEVDTEYAYVKKKTVCSFTLERDGEGKILFSEDIIGSNPRLGKFRAAIKAAVRKVNFRDGAGPQFFESPFRPMITVSDETGREDFSVSRTGQVVAARGGMSMVGAIKSQT